MWAAMGTVDDGDDVGYGPGPWTRTRVASSMDKEFIPCHEIEKGLLGQEALAM